MNLFFYGFAILMIFSSIMVITARNPVYSVLWLIFAFCNASGLMVLIGAEYIAMMLIIIYVGAIAVLFLFVVMMLDMNLEGLKEQISSNKITAFLFSLFLLADLIVIVLLATKTIDQTGVFGFAINYKIGNAYNIGKILYTDFILPFQISGIILFVAMIATISLTLRTRSGLKKQNATKQLLRNKANSLKVAKLNGKSGLNNLNYDN